ncbi:MAG: tetratricopeptide repeat protein, partial [Planctomycetes bacterium]|nr:tetratricopeptide repeat protein [Planctomycetota bacterium]
ETVKTKRVLAGRLYAQWLLPEAEALYDELYDYHSRVFGAEHDTTQLALRDLVFLYSRQNRVDEAEDCARRGLAIRQRLSGERDQKAIAWKRGLANILLGKNEWAEAEAHLREILTILRELNGEAHAETRGAMQSLAIALLVSGRDDEAETLLRRVLEIRQETLGLDKSTFGTRFWLSFLVDETERRTLETEIIEIKGNAARKTGASPGVLNNYAMALMNTPVRSLRDPSTALQFAQKANAATNRTSPATVTTLVLAYRMTGNLDMAISTAEQLLLTLSPIEKLDRMDAEILLLDCYRRKGHRAEQEELLRTMMARLTNRDPQYLKLVRHMTNIALLLAEWDEFIWYADQTRKLTGFRSGNWQFEMLGGDDLADSLVIRFIKQSRFEPAEELLRESLAIRKMALPEGHWRIGAASVLMAQSLVGQRQLGEAEPFLLEGHRILAAALETVPDHLKERLTREVAQTGMDLYEAWGKPDKAAEFRARLDGA